MIPDQLLDDFRLHTTTTAPGSDELGPQQRRIQCQEMLQSQLEQDLSSDGKTNRRPLFELSTQSFNVSCHVVPGPQFQCAL